MSKIMSSEIRNFKFDEFLNSSIGKTLGINNLPVDFEIVENIVHTAKNLQRVRDFLGRPIIVNSGYRNPQINSAVGGSKSSQHLIGQAVDFISPAFGEPYDIAKTIQKSEIEFDQMIYESTWVHISFKKTGNRKQVLTRIIDNGKTIYSPGLHIVV